MPTELELIALETEFDLYLSFTKRLVLNLPDSDDRTRAAIWLQKLRSIDDDDHKKLRNEHLKLLLFALHRRSLLGVFEKPPHEELESFHDGLTLLEMTRELIELTEKKQASGDNSGESPLPPVTTNVSADLKEYCASQSIPKFGAHVYYAVSNEPIQMWSKSPNCVYPASSDVPNPLQWELTLSKLTDHVLEKQAEAERLAAEAAHDDKTEEKDNTQILPSIDVAVCAGAGNSVFKWKADSILTLHQNYDFSDVGVAEDLEVQGKWQLELDEMAFSILDHSLPGRQKVVVRDPFYQGLPPDIAERRNHGVIDEVEVESTSSSDTESVFEGRAGKAISAFSAKDFSPRDVILNLLSKAGELAKKYLLANSGFTFGIHFENGEFKIGRYTVTFDGDDIVVDFDDHQIKIKGTEGVWRLLTQDTSSVDEMVMYTDEEWVIYMEMMMRAHDLYVTDDDFNQSSDSEEEGDEMSPEIAQFSNYEEQGYEMSQGVAQFSNYQGRGYEMPQGNAQFSNYEGQGYEMPQEASQFSHEGRSMPKKRCAKKRCCSCGKSKRRENPPPPPPCYPEMVQGDQVAPRSLGFEGAPANVDAFAFGLDKIKDKAKEWLPDTPSMPNIPRPSLPGIPNWSDKLPSKPQLPNWRDKLPGKPELPNWRDKLPSKPELPNLRDKLPSKPQLPNWRDKLPSKPEFPNLHDKLPSMPKLPNWRDKLPSKPEFPNLHDKLPSMPKLPNWRDKLPSKPEFPNLHDKLPSMPKLPNWRDKLPGKPELPNWRDKLPGKPELPNWRDKLPGKPELPNLRDKLPSMPKLPNLRDKLPNWGGNSDSDDEMPSKSKFGLKWPKLKVGMPKLGLKIPKLPKVPKLGLHLLGFSLSDLGNLIFWKIFEKKQFSYLKALDYLIRRFLEIENLRKAGKIYCIYTGNCLMFWIVEFMIALMGTKGGVKKCMDWTKVCEPLILACDLFNKIAKLFTSEKVDYPICNLREKLASQECSPEEQKKYMKFLKKDAEFENKVRKGVDALGKLFGEDASFLQKLGAYNTLSSMAVSYGIQVAFQHFKGKIFSRKSRK